MSRKGGRRGTPGQDAARAAAKREAKKRGAYTPPQGNRAKSTRHATAPRYVRNERTQTERFYEEVKRSDQQAEADGYGV